MRFLLLVPLLVGCKVVDAPESFEELVVFAFVHYEDGQRWVDASAEGVVPFVEDNYDEMLEGYRVDSLGQDDLDAAGLDVVLEEDILGAAGAITMESSLEEVARGLTYPDLSEIFERTESYDVDPIDDSDRDCFLAHECAEFRQTGTRVTRQPVIGASTQDFTMVFRWATLEDARDVLLMRVLIPDETDMSVSWLKIHQNYVLSVMFEDSGGTVRMETNWIDAEIVGMDIPDSFALDSVLGAMEAQAEELDAWISEE